MKTTLKRIAGILLICISVIISLLLILALLSPLFVDDMRGKIDGYSFVGASIFLIMAGSLFIAGRKLYKKDMVVVHPPEVTAAGQDIQVFVSIEPKPFIRISFLEAYSKPVMLFITFIGIGMAFASLDYISGGSTGSTPFSYLSIGFAAYFLFILPVSIFLQARKTLKSNPYIKEPVVYRFTADGFSAKGESFELNLKWSALHSIKERKEWYILFTDKYRALFIPKECFASTEERINFKQLTSVVPVTKTRLF